MKTGRTRTLRGSIKSSISDIKRQLILDDGRANHGLKIVSFQMWTDASNLDSYISASLSLELPLAGLPIFDAGDNRQIAWFTSTQVTSSPSPYVVPPYGVIDPDHVVNESLYIRAYGSANVIWSYLIVCEEYTLTDDEAIISMIKERTQNFTP